MVYTHRGKIARSLGTVCVKQTQPKTNRREALDLLILHFISIWDVVNGCVTVKLQRGIRTIPSLSPPLHRAILSTASPGGGGLDEPLIEGVPVVTAAREAAKSSKMNNIVKAIFGRPPPFFSYGHPLSLADVLSPSWCLGAALLIQTKVCAARANCLISVGEV
jgi:hypothetical protein